MADEIEYAPLEGPPEASAPTPEPDLHHLHDVPVELAVEIGRTRMTIGDTLKLGPGSIVSLNRLAGEPVDLLVNGKPIARGEVVVIDEEFGLRITDVVSTAERAHGYDPSGLPPTRPALDPALTGGLEPAALTPPAPTAEPPPAGEDAVAAYLRDAAGLGAGAAGPHLRDASVPDPAGADDRYAGPGLGGGADAAAVDVAADGPDPGFAAADRDGGAVAQPPQLVEALPADDDTGFPDALGDEDDSAAFADALAGDDDGPGFADAVDGDDAPTGFSDAVDGEDERPGFDDIADDPYAR